MAIWGWGKKQDGRTTKGHEKISGEEGYVHSLDCVDGSTGIWLCQNISNGTFLIWAVFWYVNYTSVKLTF